MAKSIRENQEPFHEHIYFEDGEKPSNAGYFDDGVRQDKSSSLPHMYGPHYDDTIMRAAVDNVKGSGNWNKARTPNGGYNFFFHNCQDFVDAVLKEYFNLKGIKK